MNEENECDEIYKKKKLRVDKFLSSLNLNLYLIYLI